VYKSISKLAALVIFAATFLSSPVAAHATGCSLSGQGTESDPWQVGTAEQFQQIGDGACTKDGFYRQTNDITLTTPTADITSTVSVASGFSGTYDGDFYTITLSGGWGDGTYSSAYGLFGGNLSGTIKKLNLTGEYKTSSFWGQPLVLNMNSGAIVSQVSSDVNVTVTGNLDTVKLGGLVQRLARGATIEYSRASGTLSWEPSSGSLSRNLYYGGLVTEAGMDQNGLGSDGPSTSEIRDSYSSVTFKWPDGAQCTSTTGVTTGGLVGLQTTVSGDLYVVRSYSTSKLGTGVQTTNTGCRYASLFPAVGGLVGRSDADKYLAFADVHVPTFLYFVSSFWAKDLIEGQQNSVGLPRGGSTGQYVNGLPGAVGLDSSDLKSITTYQSHEGSTPGLPGSSSDLPIGSSSGAYPSGGTPLSDASTYRWAMEQGNLTTFIPSEYTDVRNFTTRGLIADTTVSRSMEGQGQASLEGPVQNYPQLGRVWEICSEDNSGFPVLVWERKCTPTSVDPTPSPTTSPEPGTNQGELASTGANIVWLIFAGLLTTIAGFGFSVYSRRKRV
jgi:LPXTG-motif cell wall-anchored protein